MEIFIDGGLFELFAVLLLTKAFNFVYMRKWLLILFSIISVASPFVLFFIHKGELMYWAASFSLLSSVILVLLLWKQKRENPDKKLFNFKFKK